MSGLRIAPLTGADLTAALPDLARLRIDVFRDWPYLYDGELDYEQTYLQHYADSPEAIVIAAYQGDWLVGASTAAPLTDHAADFGAAFDGTGIDVGRTFYCGESVLLPRFRGQGMGHTFFDMREAHARKMGYSMICFCAVLRPMDDPRRPPDYRPLDGFWTGRGYRRVPGAVAYFNWRDVGETAESAHPLQFWARPLDQAKG